MTRSMKITSTILGISILLNVAFVAYWAYQSHRLNSTRNFAYTQVPSLASMAARDLAAASNGHHATQNLSEAIGNMQEMNGVLRGINPSSKKHGIDFTFLIDQLQANLNVPYPHAGTYTSAEMKRIRSGETTLKRIANDLKGTQYTESGYQQLKSSINKLHSKMKSKQN